MAAGKSARKVIMKERNTTLETTDHNNRDNSENIKETPDERIPGKLIGAIVAVGSLAFIGILTETVMTVLFPQLMREFNVNTATVQWITTIYLLTVAATMPLSSYLNRKFKHRVLFLAAVALAVLGSLTMIFGHAFPVILVARIIQGIGALDVFQPLELCYSCVAIRDCHASLSIFRYGVSSIRSSSANNVMARRGR